MSGYVNGVLLSILRAALTDLDPADQVQSRIRADYVNFLPYVWVRSTIGGTTLGPRVDTRAGVPIQIDAYASESRAASVLADRCVEALNAAWRGGLITTDGHINRLANISGPSLFPESDRADGIARWFVTASVTVRPPATA